MENIQPTKRRSLFGLLPPYVWICFAYIALVDVLVFWATRLFLPYLPAHSLSTPLDEMIPVVPAWVIVYFLSFPSWGITCIWMLCEDKQHAYRQCGVYTIFMLTAAICFLAYPVTIERPEITGGGPLNFMLRFLYAVDTPTNLCPSLHVVFSYHCWRGTMDCKKIPKWYQWFNFVFFILVCFCILFVKQHFISDVFVGIIVTEIALQIGRLTRVERIGFAIEKRFANRRKAA